MKLFMAYRTDSTLMEGDYDQVLAICSTQEKAVDMLKNDFQFDKFEKLSDTRYERVYDGEWTIYLGVKEIELDKEIDGL